MNLEKLKPQIKEKWVAALRSGDYPQGQGQLLDSHGRYCCLGVLCDLYIKEDWTRAGTFDMRGALPPRSVDEWAYDGRSGFPEWEVNYSEPGKNYRYLELQGLDSLNDSGLSFAEIADLIEEQL